MAKFTSSSIKVKWDLCIPKPILCAISYSLSLHMYSLIDSLFQETTETLLLSYHPKLTISPYFFPDWFSISGDDRDPFIIIPSETHYLSIFFPWLILYFRRRQRPFYYHTIRNSLSLHIFSLIDSLFQETTETLLSSYHPKLIIHPYLFWLIPHYRRRQREPVKKASTPASKTVIPRVTSAQKVNRYN